MPREKSVYADQRPAWTAETLEELLPRWSSTVLTEALHPQADIILLQKPLVLSLSRLAVEPQLGGSCWVTS